MKNRTQKARAFRNLAELQFKAILPDLTATEVLSVEPFVEAWTPGKYTKGDVRRHEGQVWECAQAHDNANNPDIEPGKSPDRSWAKRLTNYLTRSLDPPTSGSRPPSRTLSGKTNSYNRGRSGTAQVSHTLFSSLGHT